MLPQLLVDPSDVFERRGEIPPDPLSHLLDLRGLGKEIWRGINAQAYVNELRHE